MEASFVRSADELYVAWSRNWHDMQAKSYHVKAAEGGCIMSPLAALPIQYSCIKLRQMSTVVDGNGLQRQRIAGPSIRHSIMRYRMTADNHSFHSISAAAAAAYVADRNVSSLADSGSKGGQRRRHSILPITGMQIQSLHCDNWFHSMPQFTVQHASTSTSDRERKSAP